MHRRIKTEMLLWVPKGREAALRAHSIGYGSWGMLGDFTIPIQKSPKLIILPYLPFSTKQAATTGINIQHKWSGWLCNFSDPCCEGPRSWEFCHKQRISADQKQVQRKVGNWNHTNLCKVMFTPSFATLRYGVGMESSHMWSIPPLWA